MDEIPHESLVVPLLVTNDIAPVMMKSISTQTPRYHCNASMFSAAVGDDLTEHTHCILNLVDYDVILGQTVFDQIICSDEPIAAAVVVVAAMSMRKTNSADDECCLWDSAGLRCPIVAACQREDHDHVMRMVEHTLQTCAPHVQLEFSLYLGCAWDRVDWCTVDPKCRSRLWYIAYPHMRPSEFFVRVDAVEEATDVVPADCSAEIQRIQAFQTMFETLTATLPTEIGSQGSEGHGVASSLASPDLVHQARLQQSVCYGSKLTGLTPLLETPCQDLDLQLEDIGIDMIL